VIFLCKASIVGSAKASVLRWGNNEDIERVLGEGGRPVELVLAADCVYYEDGLQDLAHTIARLATSPRTEVLFRQGGRA
jgi:hypothetical protein